MAVHSKTSATNLRSSIRRNHDRNLLAASDSPDRPSRQAPGSTRAPSATPANGLLRTRKRGRHDALFSDAPTKKRKVTGEYPIRSRPVADEPVSRPFVKRDGVEEKADETVPKHPRRGRAPAATQPRASGTLATERRPVSRDANQVNGDVKHEPGVKGGSAANGDVLDAKHLAPPAPARDARMGEKRTLRSQDGGSRSRSELALYFPNYEELISNEPKETELLTAATRVYITEDPPKGPKSAGKTFVLHTPARLPPKPSPQKNSKPALRASDALQAYQTLDFSPFAKLPPPATDPLPSDAYAAAHRRAERQEKQLRNIEKERAQHEKVQLERLYDGLRGPDWLRIMGISGVTEGERKAWDGKRSYFVREVGALLEKFRVWKEEEKRRRLERERVEAEASEVESEDAQEEEESEEDEEDEDGSDGEEAASDSDASSLPENDDLEIPDSDAAASSPPARPRARTHIRTPVSLDVDALAAQQLHTEALLSAKHPSAGPWSRPSVSASSSDAGAAPRAARGRAYSTGKPNGKAPRTPKSASSADAGTPTKSASATTAAMAFPPMIQPPITSFFRKAHQRATALAGDARRHSERNIPVAFGEPIPEVEEDEFDLPREITTPDAQRASARSRRARKRG